MTGSGDPLLSLFDTDPKKAEEKIESLFKRLVAYFEWNRCADGPNLANECFLILTRRVKDGTEIHTVDPSSFVWGIARNLLLEQSKKSRLQQLDETTIPEPETHFLRMSEEERKILLEQCVQSLLPDERELLLKYYDEPWGARDHLESKGKTSPRLRILRIKRKLRNLCGLDS